MPFAGHAGNASVSIRRSFRLQRPRIVNVFKDGLSRALLPNGAHDGPIGVRCSIAEAAIQDDSSSPPIPCSSPESRTKTTTGLEFSFPSCVLVLDLCWKTFSEHTASFALGSKASCGIACSRPVDVGDLECATPKQAHR